MPVGEITAAITSTQFAIQIAKGMIGLRDAELLRKTSADLLDALESALRRALEARQAQFALEERVRELEAELRAIHASDRALADYELKQIAGGAIVYMKKPSARGEEPPSWLCQKCLENGKKSNFQPAVGSQPYYVCATCAAKIRCSPGAVPQWL